MTGRREDPKAGLDAAILEMADDAFATGAMDSATYESITARQRGGMRQVTHPTLSGNEIRAIRKGAKLSQAAFAEYLNLTVSHVSELERGRRIPTGPALVLLNVIRRHGMQMISS